PRAVPPALLALRAHGDGHLEPRGAVVASHRIVERRCRERDHELAVIEVSTVLVLQHASRLAKRGHRLWLEPQRDQLLSDLRICRVAGQIAGTMARDEVLDLASTRSM